ncbi:hypothetical protein J2Q11_12870 [Tenacibaculum finnmarkense genomovar finnmarkense]|uniref:hypothetical protein n=1 Tax=Tenacibaculum finnmarkense TaxID=2781243 RepID=UPI001E549F5B|nr:hypothetical protein [Tenacibaculum finnmarkense]MCD8418540.1 hypothetical protein [Tenacibaculum finnmarkense genomovar finnmarkense]MCG8186907.1 hypothetical protein [Tenacibaculum finnmarkense genomovar finnmarkense]MCG8203430.1 hypothetical protein [Tenacibaculum finnmarkense genomovar finnmarkense]MCG8210915.1 hypothetical protein [Tenacibaculum finnmarkense genomovar finnmarkense]MCG8213714.1 hypothetical protein [Tenacibaculum finnmarkense genomovar finnmarkense]
MRISIIYALLFILLGCKNTSSSNKYNTIATKEVKKSNRNCLTKFDKIEVKKVITDIINSLEKDDEDSLSSIFNFPISMFNLTFENQIDFVNKWNKDEELKNYLSLEIYDEDDKYIGKTGNTNVKFIFFPSEKKDNCLLVQFSIGSGLLFTLDKLDEKIKIINLDSAG